MGTQARATRLVDDFACTIVPVKLASFPVGERFGVETHRSMSLAGNITARRLSRANDRSVVSTPRGPTVGPSSDPRWDEDGFTDWAAKHAFFIRKGDLQEMAQAASRKFTEVSVHEAFKGHSPGIVGTQLFVVISLSLVDRRLDEATELEAILAVLNEQRRGMPVADSDDLICWPRHCVGESADARAELYRLFTFYRVQTVILPGTLHGRSVFHHLETMAYLALAAFCQRIANASDEAVKAGLDLSRLIDLPSTLDGLEIANGAEFDRVASMMGSVAEALRDVHHDDIGFRILCEEAQLQWLRVGYVKQLAARTKCIGEGGSCPGPCPRKQEVPQRDECCVLGWPGSCRLFVMSHGWDSMFHIDPSGRKFQFLADMLKDMGADDRDVVFIDVMKSSLHIPQPWRDLYQPSLCRLLSLCSVTPVVC